jgi:hypothetical protein
LTTLLVQKNLKTGWTAGRDQLAWLVARIAELVRLIAFEVIGVTAAKDGCLICHGNLKPAIQNNAAFLAFVSHRMLAGARARLIALL